MADRLVVGLSSWIIQDGNYGDFRCGERAAFALEFYASTEWAEIDPGRAPAPSLIHAGGAHYRTSGQVVHVADDWWAIDAGTLLYREERPPRVVRRGSWLGGEIDVGVDPFFYFERLSKRADAPPLIYDWMIEKIEIQTAPFIETRPRMMERDPERPGWREIGSTDAWNDDGGRAEYNLHCKRIDGRVRRTLRRKSAM
jgi:hypothetical protein